MKIAAAYDIVFIIALAVILVLINELGIQDDLFRFRYIGFLLGYFSGRYVSGLIYRSKLREQTNRSEKHKMLKWASTVFWRTSNCCISH